MEKYWDSKISYLEEFPGVSNADSESIVTTNGCFDVFHFGHLMSLYRTSQLANKLIVGINSDESVSRIKGPRRPVCTEYQRASIIASLPFVEQVVIFNEDTPVRFLENVRPLIHCKGEDYRDRLQTIPEYELLAQWGGRIELIPLEKDLSTTRVIELFR